MVDCTTNTTDNRNKFGRNYRTYGCDGGWMAYGYWFWYEQGAMLEKDYPYVGADQKCDHDASKTIGKAGDWGNLSSISATKEKLM